MSETPQQHNVELQVELPPDVEAGVYADFVGVWHTGSIFTLDFVAFKTPPVPTMDNEQVTGFTQAARTVARVRIPPEQVFEIARALTQQLDMWEQETGRRPPTNNEGITQ